LSLVHVPELPVYRETKENAAIVSRVSPSFIRIGSFEAHNPPTVLLVTFSVVWFMLTFSQDMFFMGMGAMQPQTNYESLRILGEWVVKNVLKLKREDDSAPWGKELVFECARRNAKMVAGWQAYGFMHGVMNTDK
jgi:serine/tyrosine/threonine adenylyltransferase